MAKKTSRHQSNMKSVLLITSLSESYYFRRFIEEGSRLGVQVYVFDYGSFPTDLTVNIFLSREGNITGTLDALVVDGDSVSKVNIDIHEIQTAWYLRPGDVRLHAELSEVEAKFVRNESQEALKSIFSCVSWDWINRREVIRYVDSNKLYQQKIAASCGLATPATLLSNDPEKIIAFAKAWDGLLVKPITYTQIADDSFLFIYSNRFGLSELSGKKENLRSCPNLVQTYVPKKFEYRVMAIGDQILACQIDSQSNVKTQIDWRHYDKPDKGNHIRFSLPSEVESKLLLFMKRIGLRYGAIDMIRTTDDEWVFLEVNPSGQWGWIADLADLPIARTVAEELFAK